MPLSVGDLAPDFTLPDQHGALARLADQVGPVLLVFFPAAFTPVCTDEWRSMTSAGLGDQVDVWGVSCDPVATLRAYAGQEALTVRLLSDFWPHGAVASAYGAFVSDRGIASRTSYLLDGRRIVRRVWAHDPLTARTVTDYAHGVRELAD